VTCFAVIQYQKSDYDMSWTHVKSRRNKCWFYSQTPIWFAFSFIQGCSIIFWSEILFEESFTSSCTNLHTAVRRTA